MKTALLKTRMNPFARKAVLILEAENGGVVVQTIYDPRVEVSYQDEFSTASTTTLSFTEGLIWATDPSNEEKQAEVSQTYAQARKEALVAEAEASTSVMPTPDELIAMNLRTHEEAIQAVYQLGVAAGAKMVQFRDAHVEKEMAQIPLTVLDRVLARLGVTQATKGKKSQLGLKTARREVEKLRQEIKDQQVLDGKGF